MRLLGENGVNGWGWGVIFLSILFCVVLFFRIILMFYVFKKCFSKDKV